MRLLIVITLVLIGAVGAALLVMKDPGYVLLSYGHWSAETSLSFFVLALLVLYMLLHYLGRFLHGAWVLPRRVHAWRGERHGRRARISFSRGMVALAEGRWKAAEKELLRHVRDADTPILNYLAAARAAQELGAVERRDEYLHQAHESTPASALAVGLSQARLQMDQQQLEQALATLSHLRTVEPDSAYVLRTLMSVYTTLKDWTHLRELLPDLRRRQVLSAPEARDLELRLHLELLRQVSAGHDVHALRKFWDEAPRHLREEQALVLAYGRALRTLGAGAEAEPLVRTALRRQWNPQLVYLYGLLDGEQPARQLAAAEAWTKDHGKDPVLLLTLGRLCVRNRLWGKARIYFESSIGAGPSLEAYRELGALLEHIGDGDGAMECYREGMGLVEGDAAALPEPETEPKALPALEKSDA
jgi:HemY protein